MNENIRRTTKSTRNTRNIRNIKNINIENKQNIENHETTTENTEIGNTIRQIVELIIRKGGTTLTGGITLIAEITPTAETITIDERTTGSSPGRTTTAGVKIDETTIAGMIELYKRKTPTTKSESRLSELA